jgi:DNA-binding MarR family transcriptional regulator
MALRSSKQIRDHAVKATDTAWRRQNIGRHLNQAVRRFEKRVIEIVEESGYPDMRVSFLNLTRNLDVEGTRITELAQRAGITKQSMSELVAQCVKAGLVTQRPYENDGRARLIVFTRKGLALLEAFRGALIVAEREMRKEIGANAFKLINTALANYGAKFGTLKGDAEL